MYVFDTNILVEFLRGRLPEGLELLQNTDCRLVKIPAIVQSELLVGACKSRNPEKATRAVERLICNYEVLPFDTACAYSYARIRADLESAGKVIGPNDLLIAATAIAHHAILVTNNVDEFKRVPSLQIMAMREVDV
ncbi:MAG: type II toxin-antitoxin system VapC family toxin [Eggerthellaceae bacterium]|nr:type II toxin-antitoxin system VapC family toxin [Eggerthellaceae bacterium]